MNMDTVRSLFVSYSGRVRADKMFAVRLLRRLRQLDLDPWVYEQRGEEIAPGEAIDDACRRRIRKADVFVCLISDSSLASPSTAMEVGFAATLFEPGDIFQIVTATLPQQAWPEPYRSLLPYKHVDAGRMDDADLERVLRDLCARLDEPYTPPGDPAPKLPLIRRLAQELYNARPARPGYESATCERLLQRAMDAAQAYAEGRANHAVSAIETLEYELAAEYPEHGFYYPHLVKAVLLLGLPSRQQFLDKAQRLLEDIVNDPRLRDNVDENAYAALAVVALRRNAPQEALASYLQAHALVASRGEVDPDILHNIVVASLASGVLPDGLDPEELLAQALDHGAATHEPLLRERLTALRAAVLASRGDLDGAEACLDGVDCNNGDCMDLLCRIAQDLAAHPASRAAATAVAERLFDLVAAHGTREQRNTALLSQAEFRYGQGRFDDALHALNAVDRALACQTHIMLEQALVFLNLQQIDKAQQVLMAAADSHISFDQEPAVIKETLYYRGFAAWLLNRPEAALSDFRDSDFAEPYAYPLAAQRHLGALLPDFGGGERPGGKRSRWLI
jgi:hypothetical protein